MSGLLQEKNEIEKIQNEFKNLTDKTPSPTTKTTAVKKEELVFEECEL